MIIRVLVIDGEEVWAAFPMTEGNAMLDTRRGVSMAFFILGYASEPMDVGEVANDA